MTEIISSDKAANEGVSPVALMGSPSKQDDELAPALRAEQMLLLALHPESPSPRLPSVPPSSSTDIWAEPGWHVVLDASREQNLTTPTILPSMSSGSLIRTFLSECTSAPGRQAASLLKPRHLRMLTAPLSSISQSSAPAEPYPSGLPKSSDGKTYSLNPRLMFITP
eukprot:15358061-Ditylum_brightwellii.AAC.1